MQHRWLDQGMTDGARGVCCIGYASRLRRANLGMASTGRVPVLTFGIAERRLNVIGIFLVKIHETYMSRFRIPREL